MQANTVENDSRDTAEIGVSQNAPVQKLRSLYAPVWSLSLKGALIGVITVGILKSLDTLVGLVSVNPGAAFLWLLIGAAIFSPKWKIQLLGAALFIGWKSGLNTMMLWGAWFGVGAFAAVFGVSAGMPIGTVVGLIRAKRIPGAPDAPAEGSKPFIWGLAVPLTAFVIAAIVYVKVVMPAIINTLSH